MRIRTYYIYLYVSETVTTATATLSMKDIFLCLLKPKPTHTHTLPQYWCEQGRKFTKFRMQLTNFLRIMRMKQSNWASKSPSSVPSFPFNDESNPMKKVKHGVEEAKKRTKLRPDTHKTWMEKKFWCEFPQFCRSNFTFGFYGDTHIYISISTKCEREREKGQHISIFMFYLYGARDAWCARIIANHSL